MCVVPPVAFVELVLSHNKSSGAADFDCLLTMNDNCNEIDHCSVRMMMVIKKNVIVIGAWVTRPERPKGAKDEVKDA